MIEKIEEFQQKYLNLLKVILKEVNNHEINIRDELLIFFNKNKMLLGLYLKYYLQEEINYFLTGSIPLNCWDKYFYIFRNN